MCAQVNCPFLVCYHEHNTLCGYTSVYIALRHLNTFHQRPTRDFIAERLNARHIIAMCGLQSCLEFLYMYVCTYICMYTYILPVSHVSCAWASTCMYMYMAVGARTYVHTYVSMMYIVYIWVQCLCLSSKVHDSLSGGFRGCIRRSALARIHDLV